MNLPAINPDAPFGYDYGPHLTDPFSPVLVEEVHRDLPVEGTIPADLNGVYLRNGPNPRFEPKGAYHPFDGDGMLHNAVFRNGSVTIGNKWIRTEAWQKEDLSHHAEYWGIRQTLKGVEEKPLKDSANTDVIGHAGLAVATWYMAGVPYLLDPVTLATVKAAESYVGQPGAGMSAHCKVDEQSGHMMFFDYSHEHPHMRYGVIDGNGVLVHQVPIEVPNRLPHDMAITEHYSILHDHPVFHDEAAHAAGRHKIVFDSKLPSRFGVIPRFGASDSIRWFEFSPCYVYHCVNAWEDGDEIVLIACRYLPARTDDGSYDDRRTAKMIGELVMDARLWRYRMNLRTGETREEPLNLEHNVEFPSYDSARTGRFTQWAYLVDHDPKILRWTGITKYNTTTGERVGEWTDGHDDCWYSEPWFAPADNQQSEDHGYVIVFVWNAASRQQQLQVFDARDLSKGPIARVKMPHRIPPGFHACWMKPAQIAGW